MLKFFYRLKKRGGVVLFAVIAFMTLLITMASVAYFTARASFNTVVSNYDFSQMYISTTSVSDMLIEALSQDTSKAGAAVTDNLNYFKDLKTKVDDLISAVTLDPTKINTADATLTGVSGNVSYLDKDNTEKLLQDGSNNAVEPGVLDAVKSTIKIIKVDLNVPELGGRNKYYFTFTTVGYYRNNTITVQDTLYAVAGPKGTKGNKLFTTFFTATGQELSSGVVDETGRAVIINTQEVSDNAYFQNKFTIFVQSDANNTFRGGLRTTGGLYIGHLNNMSIPAPTTTERHDWIIGGDFYLGGNGCINLNGNDLFVHGDLYLANAQAIQAGNVYVEGNIYLCMSGSGGFSLSGGTQRVDKDGKPTEAYAANGLYVNGNVIPVSDPSSVTTGTSTWGNGKNAIAALIGPSKNPSTLTLAEEIGAINDLISAAQVNPYDPNAGLLGLPCSVSAPSVSGGTFYQPAGHSGGPFGSGTAFNWNDLNVQISEQVEEPDEYDTEINTTTVDGLLDPSGGMSRIDYDNYSAAQNVYDRVVSLDFSQVPSGSISAGSWFILWSSNAGAIQTVVDGRAFDNPAIDHFEADGTAKDAEGNTIDPADYNEIPAAIITYGDTNDWGNQQNVTVDLPYISGGYMLQYTNLPTNWAGQPVCTWNSNGTPVFRIHSPNGDQLDEDGNPVYVMTTDEDGNEVPALDEHGHKIPVPEAMPIVLMANFDDNPSDTTANRDENGNNAFRWTAGDSGSSGGVTVELVDKDNTALSAVGNVVFEMGTYNTSTGKYESYETSKSGSLDCPTYYTRQGEKVGTLNQVNGVTQLQPGKPEDADQFGWLISGSNDIQAAYDNKIIFVSNKNNCKVAFNARKGDSTFCGYLYAPNAIFDGWQDKSTMPIFGGMIVSDYRVKLGSYLYGEPDPKLIAALGNTLKSKNSHTPTPASTETTWGLKLGKNYFG